MELREELEKLINKCCEENKSNTPDFILALFLQRCLTAFEYAIIDRDNWYGVHLEPGKKMFLGNTCESRF